MGREYNRWVSCPPTAWALRFIGTLITTPQSQQVMVSLTLNLGIFVPGSSLASLQWYGGGRVWSEVGESSSKGRQQTPQHQALRHFH